MPQHRASDRQIQMLYVNEELLIAVSTVETGMAILQNNHLYRRNEFPLMLMLSSGIERVLKIVQHLGVFNTEGRFRAVRRTHDLGALRIWVLRECFTATYRTKPNMHADRDYLTNDPLLLAMFGVLSDFSDARGSRYLYMDAIANPQMEDASDRWPKRQWERLEMLCIDTAGGIRPEIIEQQHKEATRQLVGVVERFMRIIGRLFRFGGLGDAALPPSTYFSKFIRMAEHEFGTVAYPV